MKRLSDENLEKLRDICSNVRDLAILELLISTGMRVGELTRLNIADMNFQERSCIVLGKGNSERKVYFSAKIKCSQFLGLKLWTNGRKCNIMVAVIRKEFDVYASNFRRTR